jgi:hypothetical protein
MRTTNQDWGQQGQNGKVILILFLLTRFDATNIRGWWEYDYWHLLNYYHSIQDTGPPLPEPYPSEDDLSSINEPRVCVVLITRAV